MFNLQRFNEEIYADFNIFPEEYEGYTITVVVSWISDGYIRSVFQSKIRRDPPYGDTKPAKRSKHLTLDSLKRRWLTAYISPT